MAKIDIGAYRQVGSHKTTKPKIDIGSYEQANPHTKLPKTHIDVGAYSGKTSHYHRHHSSSKGNGNKDKGGSQDYQNEINESAKLEKISAPVFPQHKGHSQGSIAKRAMNLGSGYIQVTISTVSATYPLVPRTASHDIPDDSESKLIADLISVQVQNDMQNDIPTCTFVLGNSYDWSSLLVMNDLIRVDYIIPERENQFSSFDKCLYTGLISNLSRNANYNGSEETYTVVCQGMAKIFSNIQLSTFSDLQSNLNGYQLLPDDEKTGIGFKQHTSANIIKQIINRFILQNQGGANTYDYLASQNGEDITRRATPVQDGHITDLMGQPMSLNDYMAYMDYIQSQAGDDGNTDKDDDKSDNDNQDAQANNPYPNLAQQPNLNIPLMVSAGDELPIQNLIEFYIYENLDESYPDAGPSNPFVNYNGSILQFIKDVSAKPFNEMYWTHNRGIATFNYRPTPFDPENWYALQITELAPGDITDVNISNTDQDQAAIFKLTPTQGLGIDQYDGGFTGDMAPLTNLALVRRYGYKLMQTQVDYFNGNKQEDPLSQVNAGTTTADSEALKGYTDAEARLKAPPYTSICDFFYYTSGRKSKSDAESIPKEAGGTAGYNLVAHELKASPNAIAFYNNVRSLGIDQPTANALWTERNGFNRLRYLSVVMPNYQGTDTGISRGDKYLGSFKRMQKDPKGAASKLIEESGYTLGPAQAYALVQDALANGGKPSEDQYEAALNIPFDQQVDGVNGSPDSGQASVPFLFLRYTEKLFDWYADNAKFYSGTISLSRFSDLDTAYIGERVEFYDDASLTWWEFYCEGISVNWSYTGGLQVTLNVTRGVPLGEDEFNYGKRFNEYLDPVTKKASPSDSTWSFWGQSVPFRGGYFGEQNLATAIANSSKDGDGGSKGSGDLIETAKDIMNNENWTYSQGMRTDFRKNGHADCSSFVWYVCNKCGYDVGPTAFTTFSEPQFLDEISADDTDSGSIVVANGNPHTAFLEEKWHGGDTQIINMGGEGAHDGMGDVNEDTYERAFGSSNMSNYKFYKAKKK